MRILHLIETNAGIIGIKAIFMKQIRTMIKEVPYIGAILRSVARTFRKLFLPGSLTFPGSRAYWEKRYVSGGTSGAGSYGVFAEFKAEILNAFVKDNNVESVIEFGCGDGHQLSLASYPYYVGLDVSNTAIELCTEHFRDDNNKRFAIYNPDNFVDSHGIFKAELALSLDVIYHLIEDRIFELHMRHLFSAAEKYVIIYSSNTDGNQVGHERHRKFSEWIDVHLPEWDLLKEIPNRFPYSAADGSGSLASFFMYVKS